MTRKELKAFKKKFQQWIRDNDFDELVVALMRSGAGYTSSLALIADEVDPIGPHLRRVMVRAMMDYPRSGMAHVSYKDGEKVG